MANVPNNLRSFAIRAGNVGRARRFYEAVFGWCFEPWGQPEFYLILTGDRKQPGILGLLHKQQEPVTGSGMTGFECTVGVADIDQIISAVRAAGGKIVMEKFHIHEIGMGVYFSDTEGNLVGAMQYEKP